MIARFFATLTQDQKETVLDDASDEIVTRLQWYRDALEEASALRQLRGHDRLLAFQQRLPQVWQKLQEAFPNEYSKQMSDWKRLEQRSLFRASPDSTVTPSYERLSTSNRLNPPLPLPSSLQGSTQ